MHRTSEDLHILQVMLNRRGRERERWRGGGRAGGCMGVKEEVRGEGGQAGVICGVLPRWRS